MSATVVSVSASSLSNIGYSDVLQILLGGRGTQCSSRSAWATESGKRLFNFLCYVYWHRNVAAPPDSNYELPNNYGCTALWHHQSVIHFASEKHAALKAKSTSRISSSGLGRKQETAARPVRRERYGGWENLCGIWVDVDMQGLIGLCFMLSNVHWGLTNWSWIYLGAHFTNMCHAHLTCTRIYDTRA